ncbi:hypothetical protein [Mesorhizobium retamae]|uniref:Uncharacterized protein n=1 Tax=Mesorhizobium retamae TaxID=2912854 RepID=A0ABS9QNG8_9HYPH|nr:hypothetical protein [Mesorhizobium sp. IRAMC:0171]MCG7508860.1 hypothetical protein [Mesorhizobium sp. IRAMC:0171]
MSALLSFLNSKIGVYAICSLIGAAFIGWVFHEVYEAGRAYERTAMLNRSVIILRERSKTDATVSAMDDAALCAALGGRMSDGSCE